MVVGHVAAGLDIPVLRKCGLAVDYPPSPGRICVLYGHPVGLVDVAVHGQGIRDILGPVDPGVDVVSVGTDHLGEPCRYLRPCLVRDHSEAERHAEAGLHSVGVYSGLRVQEFVVDGRPDPFRQVGVVFRIFRLAAQFCGSGKDLAVVEVED